nr:unnamed protein product [Callosobruchus analis]
MEQYTSKERVEIVQIYIQNNFSIVKTRHAFRSKNKVKSASGDNTIRCLYAGPVNSGNASNT